MALDGYILRGLIGEDRIMLLRTLSSLKYLLTLSIIRLRFNPEVFALLCHELEIISTVAVRVNSGKNPYQSLMVFSDELKQFIN